MKKSRLQEKIINFAVLAFAAYVSLATSYIGVTLKDGKYNVNSDCPGAQPTGTVEIVGSEIKDGTAFGFPSNRLTGAFAEVGQEHRSSPVLSIGENRSCRGHIFIEHTHSIMFMCTNPKNEIECTILIEKIGDIN